MKKNNDIKSKMLSDDQTEAIKQAFIGSMQDTVGKLTESGVQAATNIVNTIIKNAQMMLLQGSVFEKAAKKGVRVPSPAKKTKKHAR